MKNKAKAPGGSSTRVVPALLLAGLSAAASAAETSVTELAPITVSAHGGNAVPYDQTGVSVTVLDMEELRSEGVFNLSDALTTVPGAAVLPGGGLEGKGNASNIVVRGMARQTYLLPMIDGMLVSGSNGNGNVTPNIIARSNTFDIGTAELLRGTQGAIYGGGAVAGVLFMETPRGEGEPTATLFQEAGSHDTYTANLRFQGQQDKLHYFVSGTYEHTDNDIHSANGAIPDTSKAGRYECFAEALRLDYDLNEATTFTTTYRREDAWFDKPSYYGVGWSTSPFRFRTNLVTAKVESKITNRYNSSLMAGYYGTDNMMGHGTNYDLRNIQAEWRNSLRWCQHQTTNFSFRWTHSQYDSSSWGASNTKENLYSVAVDHIVSPVKEWVSSLAVRLDYSSIYHALPTARAASSYSFDNTGTRLFGSFGHGYRGPSSFERSVKSYRALYVWDGGFQEYIYHGTPNLDCETSWSADFGVEQALSDKHTVSLTYFWQQVKDAIRDISADGTNYYYYNAPGHWTSQGVELALNGSFGDAWNTCYKLAYTYTQPKQQDDQSIPNSCRQVWSADIHTHPTEKLTTGMGLAAATGRRDWDASRMDSYYTLRCYASYEVNENLTLHARVENLTNQKFVTDSSSGNILAPGTSVYGGATVTF